MKPTMVERWEVMRMNAKEYLSQAMWLDKSINNKLEQMERLKAIAEKVTVDFTQEKVSGGKATTSPMEDATVKLIDLSNEINQDIDLLVDLKKEIIWWLSFFISIPINKIEHCLSSW